MIIIKFIIYGLFYIYFLIPVIEREKLRDIDRWVPSTSILVRNSYDILWIIFVRNMHRDYSVLSTVLPQPA